MSNNSLKAEYEVFSAYGFKTYSDNKPTVNLQIRDGYAVVGGYFVEEDIVRMIEILQTALTEAKETKDHDPMEWDDTPF